MNKKILVLGPYPPPYNGLSLCTKEDFEKNGDFLIGTGLESHDEGTRIIIKKGFFPMVLPRMMLEIMAKRKEVKRIEAHFATTFGFAAYLAKKFWRIKYRVHAHGSDVLVNFKNPLLKLMGMRAFKNAEEIVAVSEKIKNVLVDSGVPEKKITVRYDQVDESRFKKMQVKKENWILFVGSVHPVKGVDVLLKAFKKVSRKFPKYRLVLAGRITNREYHEKLLKIYNKKIEFLGERRDIPEIMNKSKLFVLPSRSEGYGRVLVEALACGLPVVASNVGGIPEIIKDSKNGILVEPENVEELAKAIEKVLIKAK